MFHSLLCGITYNGTAAKIHCAVERDYCAAIKRLKNDVAIFVVLKYTVIGIEAIGKSLSLIYTCYFRNYLTIDYLKNWMTEKTFLLYLVPCGRVAASHGPMKGLHAHIEHTC